MFYPSNVTKLSDTQAIVVITLKTGTKRFYQRVMLHNDAEKIENSEHSDQTASRVAV